MHYAFSEDVRFDSRVSPAWVVDRWRQWLVRKQSSILLNRKVIDLNCTPIVTAYVDMWITAICILNLSGSILGASYFSSILKIWLTPVIKGESRALEAR